MSNCVCVLESGPVQIHVELCGGGSFTVPDKLGSVLNLHPHSWRAFCEKCIKKWCSKYDGCVYELNCSCIIIVNHLEIFILNEMSVTLYCSSYS